MITSFKVDDMVISMFTSSQSTLTLSHNYMLH